MFSLGCIQALKCNKNTCPTGITTHNPRFQRGLDPTDKAVKVANYCKNMVHDVEVLAHSCGVGEPRKLRRYHVRIVQNDGSSVSLDVLRPTLTSPDQLNLVDRHPGIMPSTPVAVSADSGAVPGQG
jgi:hypothetical protein